MRLNKKSIILPILAILLTASCGGGSDGVSSIEGDKNPFGKYQELTTIEMVRTSDSTIDSTILAHYPDETLIDNRFSQLYLDKLNLKVNYKFIAADAEDYQNKINLAMTSGQLPEFMIVDTDTAKKLYEAEVLKPLDDMWADYASPYLKSITGQDELAACSFGGNLYGIPQMYSTIDRAQFCFVRLDWIKKLNEKDSSLNLKENPQTIDELEAIARAFIDKDPDGNGKKDTQGILFQGDIWADMGGFTGIFNAYESYPNIWVENQQGNLEFGSVQQTTKNALTKLSQWYQDGIISREFVSQSSSTIASTLTQGKAGIFFCEQWGCQYPLQDVYNLDDSADWVALPLMTATSNRAKTQASMGTYGWWVATNNCSRPEAVIKMMNVYLDSIWGENGDFEKYYMPSDTGASIWKLSPVTPEPPTKNLDAYLEIKKAMNEQSTTSLKGEAKQIYQQIQSYLDGKDSLWSWSKGYNPENKCVYETMNYYVENELIKYDEYVGAPTDTMSDKYTLIQKEQNKVFVNIITGAASVDTFDTFVETFGKLGGTQITNEVNAARK